MKGNAQAEGPPPPNDECEEAFVVVEGTWPFDTTSMTTSPPFHPGTCGADGFIHRDSWFEYVAGCAGNVPALVTSPFPARIAAYTGNCVDLQLIGCSGDAGCGTAPAVLVFPVQPGESYLLRIGGSSEANAGPGELALACLTGAVALLVAALTPCAAAILGRGRRR